MNQNNIDFVELKRTSKPTKRFNIIVNGNNTKSQFECPKCGNKIWYSGVSYPNINYCDFLLKDDDFGIVIIDNVKKDTLKIVRDFKNIGWKIALDIGYISHLRYMNEDKINKLFSFQVDYFQTNSTVTKILISKLKLRTEEELFARLGCIYLNITDGNKGSRLYYSSSEGINKSDCLTINTTVIDTTGAGDAFFSVLLSQIGVSGIFEEDILSVQQQAVKYATDRLGVIGALGKCEHITLPSSQCMFCGQQMAVNIHRTISKKSITEKNATLLLERTLNALNTGAAQKIQDYLLNIQGNVFTVGTGGSYSVAVYVAKLINDMNLTSYASAKHPRDVLIEGVGHVNSVLLFSYSGRTWDIRQVYNLCKEQGIEVLVITQMDQMSNRGYYYSKDIVTYNDSAKGNRERGFISMAGTIIPTSLFTQAIYSPKEDFSNFISRRFNDWTMFFSRLQIDWNEFEKRPIINIFSGFDTVSASTDLESKIIESGLGLAIVHEKKDFSHGRFNTIEYHSPYAIIFFDNEDGKYSQKLLEYLYDRKIPRIIVLSSNRGKVLGDFDLLIGCQFFAKYLSLELKIDLSQPNYPAEAMKLYKYGRKDLI